MKPVILLTLAMLSGCGGGTKAIPGEADSIPGDQLQIFLEIETPSDGTRTSGLMALVTGRVVGTDGGQISVAPWETGVIDGFFSLWVPLEQGENTIALVHSPSGATASVTVFQDSLPPLLEVEVPERGAVLPEGGTVEVRFQTSDEEGLGAVRVQDQKLSPDGPFAALIQPGPGMHHLIVEAEDGLGNLAREHRSVLVGPLLACDDLADAPALSLGAGPDVLDIAAAEVSAALGSMDMGELLTSYNPVYSADAFQVNLDDLELDGIGVALSPGVERLDLAVVADELRVYATLSSDSTEMDLILTLSGVSVAGGLMVTVPEPGVLDVAAVDLALVTDSLELAAFDAAGEEVIAPTTVSGAFLDFVTDFIADAVSAQSAELLAGAAGYGEGSIPLELFGEEILIEYTVMDAVVQPGGLRLDLAGAFTLKGEPVHPWEHGCPGVSTPLPDVPPSGGLHVWVAYPFLDRVLLGLWARGWLDFSIDQAFVDDYKAEVTLVCGMLGTMLDFADLGVDPEAPMEIKLSTPLPPVLSPSASLDSGVALDIGGLTLDFSCAGQAAPQARAHVALSATLGFQVAESQLSPVIEFGDLLLDLSGIPAEEKRRVEGGIEVALEGFFAELLPALSSALSPVDLPAVMGYQMTSGIAGNDPDSDWFRLHALITGGTE